MNSDMLCMECYPIVLTKWFSYIFSEGFRGIAFTDHGKLGRRTGRIAIFCQTLYNCSYIPNDLIEKMKASQYFNQGFATVEFTAAVFLARAGSTLTDTVEPSYFF